MFDRLTFEREVSLGGEPEREAPHVERELPPRARPSAAVLVDFDKLDAYVNSKKAKFPQAADAPLRYIVKRDRQWIRYRSEKEPVQYPAQLWKSTAGRYLAQWSAEGKLDKITDLDSGVDLKQKPFFDPLLAGSDEVAELRKRARFGVVWVQDTVPDSPPEDRTLPNEFPLHKYPSVGRKDAEALLEAPLNPLIIPYPTSDVIEPNSLRGSPLNFTYYLQTGEFALVSRKYFDEEYFYLPPIRDIADYLKFYGLSQGGKSAMKIVKLYEIIGEIGVYFVPIIGPIYGLYQAGKSAHQLITNWDKMGGWEKALAITDVVFAKFDVIKGARIAVQTAKGASLVKRGKDALVAGGLSAADSVHILDAVKTAGRQGMKFQAVLELASLLKKGERLNPEQLRHVQDMYEALLKTLKPRDRLLAEAVHAMHDLPTAQAFLLGTEITARQLTGLKRLDPESLVRLRETAKKSEALVPRVAEMAAHSEEAAVAIQSLSAATRSTHFAKVVLALGEEVLDRIGRGMAKLDPKVLATASKAGTHTKAYRILMDGLPKLNLPGIAQKLWQRVRLPKNLEQAAARFKKRGMYLNELQLQWFDKLPARLQDILAAAPESEFWQIAKTADNSQALAKYADNLIAAGVKSERVLAVLNGVGLRLIGKAEELGVQIPPDLLRQAAKVSDGIAADYRAAQVVLQGKGAFDGMLKRLADKIPNHTELKKALEKTNSVQTGGDLTAYWMLKEAKGLGSFHKDKAKFFGVAAIARVRPKDAREAVSKIYRTYTRGDEADDVLYALGRVVNLYGDPDGLSHIVGDLAAGGDKSRGALFVLDFAANQGKKITHIERPIDDTVLRPKWGIWKPPRRKYDLVADEINYEMKFWTNWSGRKVASAVDEFMRDIVQHAGDFSKFRWVFKNEMQVYEQQIVQSFREAFKDRWVIDALKQKGVAAEKALANFEAAVAARDRFLMFR